MGTRDFIDLFKLNILKNSWLHVSLICWLVLYSYLHKLFNFFHLPILELTPFLPHYDDWPLPLDILKFIFWILTFLVVKELFSRFIAFRKRGIFYEFTSDSWYKDWVFNGKTRISEEYPPILEVNSSRAGCLLDRYVWKNFEMKFDMRFMERKILGIVFRAEDLENYFMLQLRIKEKSLVIVPHLRYWGMWEQMSEDTQDTLDPENKSEWLRVNLQVKDSEAILSMNNFETYTWHLPTHVDINHIEFGTRKNKNSNSDSNVDSDAKVTYLPKIPFRDIFGRVGFRAHLDEGADIKNLTVEKI